ncbi:Uncharacterised protein [Brucella suis]|nr:Uncharacterised protein [Brucella suis]
MREKPCGQRRNRTAFRSYLPRKQVEKRGFSSTARADDRDPLAFSNIEIEAFQCCRRGAFMAHRHVFKHDSLSRHRQRQASRFRRFFKLRPDPARRKHGAAEFHRATPQSCKRLHGTEDNENAEHGYRCVDHARPDKQADTGQPSGENGCMGYA